MKKWGMFLVAGALMGCSYTHYKGGGGADDQQSLSVNCGPVDFNTINAKVFKRSCTGCHSPDSGEDVKGLYFTDYDSIAGHISQSVDAVLSGRMPKNSKPLGKAEKELLIAWMNQKTPQTTSRPSVQSCSDAVDTPTPTPPPVVQQPGDGDGGTTTDALEPNFNSLYKNVFSQRCTGCHGINDHHDKPAKHNYATYASIIQYKNLFDPLDETSRFADALITGDMPRDGDPLTDEEIAVVVEWIKAGLPETKGGPPAFELSVGN